MLTLPEIRAKLLEKENKKTTSYAQGGDSASYRFWDMDYDATATVRFLPDADPKNDYFWVERTVIKLPFSGIKGGDSKETIVQVPCMSMFGENCPILSETRPWWNDDTLKDLAKVYWKKVSYVFQGFVVNSTAPLDETPPENPIRRFIINPSLFAIITAAMKDPDFEYLPTDYENGVDFNIVKKKKGQFADYGTSNYRRTNRALSLEEAEAIEKYGLFNLSDFRPKKPTKEELDVIVDMFHASVNGEEYDEERWGNYYRPFGMMKRNDTDTPASPPSRHIDTSIDQHDEEVPFEKATPNATAMSALERLKAKASGQQPSDEQRIESVKGKETVDDILAKIKQRGNN